MQNIKNKFIAVEVVNDTNNTNFAKSVKQFDKLLNEIRKVFQ